MASRYDFLSASLLIFAIGVSAFVGCGVEQTFPVAEEPEAPGEVEAPLAPQSITVTDSAGREVEIRLPVERVVILNARAAEVMRAIGAAGLVVGINSTMKDRDAAFWPEWSQLPAVGAAFTPNAEAIAQLRPDLVVAYSRRPGPTFDEQMAKFGIKVLRLDCFWPQEMADDARLLGRIFGKDDGAERLMAFMEKWGGLVEERIAEVPQEERPKVFVESYGEFRGAGPGSAGHEMCGLAGGRNIVGELKTSYPSVSTEWILEQNPYAIVKAITAAAGGYGADNLEGMRAIRAEMMARAGWGNLSAVREGRVFLVSSNVWLGPSHVAARAQLAKWFYPDRFEDVDPLAILVEYLKEFHGLDDPGAPFYP